MHNPPTILANPFSYFDTQVRTAIGSDSQIWFCAKDICHVLGLKNTSKSVEGLDNEERDTITSSDGVGRKKDMIFVSESGLYALIFNSRKPEAKNFRKWVTSEVLPAIRKSGSYGALSAKDHIAGTRLITSLLQELKKTKDLFARELILKRLFHACNMLGETLPDISNIGKDYRQHPLPFQDAG